MKSGLGVLPGNETLAEPRLLTLVREEGLVDPSPRSRPMPSLQSSIRGMRRMGKLLVWASRIGDEEWHVGWRWCWLAHQLMSRLKCSPWSRLADGLCPCIWKPSAGCMEKDLQTSAGGCPRSAIGALRSSWEELVE